MKLTDGHFLIGQNCYACSEPFDSKKSICLIPLGPEADKEAREAAKEGQIYNAVCIPLHYACATGLD